MKLVDCWNREAVTGWSSAKVAAWRERRRNPNAYLYRFPAPGEQQATGAFTAEEQRLLEARVAEFQSKGWPLASWGIFSLALPGRVGYQCCAQYKKNFGSEQEGAKATPAQAAACQAYHAAQLEQLWSGARAQRVSAKVDEWLKDRPQPVAQQQQGPPASKQQARAATASSGGRQLEQPAQPGRASPAAAHPLRSATLFSDSDSDFETAPRQVSRPAVSAPAAAAARNADSGFPGPYKPAGAAPGPGCAGQGQLPSMLSGVVTGSGPARRPSGFLGGQLQPAAAAPSGSNGSLPFSRFSFGVGGAGGSGAQLQQAAAVLWGSKLLAGSRAPLQDAHGGSVGAAATAAKQPAASVPKLERSRSSTALGPLVAAAAACPVVAGAAAPPLARQGLGLGASKANLPATGPQKPKAPPAQKPAKPAGAAVRGSGGRRGDSSDSDDDFVAGSLRQATALPPPAAGSLPSGTAKPPKPGSKRKRVWKSAADGLVLTTSSRLAGEDLGGAGDAVVSIKLQQVEGASSMPGWAPRAVAPYQPQQPLPAAGLAAPDRRVVVTDDILSFDLSSLGGGFEGVLISAPFVDSSPAPVRSQHSQTPAAGPSPAAAASGGPAVPSPEEPSAADDPVTRTGITTTQLASLRLDRVVSSGILCVWADKRHVAEVVRCMVGSWDATYVENLTWLQLLPNGNVLQEPSALLNRSHSTLLMGRKGPPSSLELRHQRTPDVIITPALPPGRCPDEARAMLETLLPAAANFAKDGRLRLLEICCPGTGSDGGGDTAHLRGRPGWVTLVQREMR